MEKYCHEVNITSGKDIREPSSKNPIPDDLSLLLLSRGKKCVWHSMKIKCQYWELVKNSWASFPKLVPSRCIRYSISKESECQKLINQKQLHDFLISTNLFWIFSLFILICLKLFFWYCKCLGS